MPWSGLSLPMAVVRADKNLWFIFKSNIKENKIKMQFYKHEIHVWVVFVLVWCFFLCAPIYIWHFNTLSYSNFTLQGSLKTKSRHGRLLCQITRRRMMTPSAYDPQFGQTLRTNLKNKVRKEGNTSAHTKNIFLLIYFT